VRCLVAADEPAMPGLVLSFELTAHLVSVLGGRFRLMLCDGKLENQWVELPGSAAHLFDNYVILHFDPDDRGTDEEARKAARDPVLFGVVKGSRVLYFVGDWVDELCDLTLEQIAETLAVGPDGLEMCADVAEEP